MRNGIHLTAERFCEFSTLVEEYGVWKSPRETRRILLDISDGCREPRSRLQLVPQKGHSRNPRRAAALIRELMNGRHFLMLNVKRRSDIPRIERFIHAMNAEAIELCDIKRAEREGYVPETVVVQAFFIIAFEDEGLTFHEIRGKDGLRLFSTLGEHCPVMPPTYCLRPGQKEGRKDNKSRAAGAVRDTRSCPGADTAA